MDFKWHIFKGVDAENIDVGSFGFIPESIIGVKREEIPLNDGVWRSPDAPEEPESALFMCEFTSERAQWLAFGFGACYYARFLLNGIPLLDNREWTTGSGGTSPIPRPRREISSFRLP